MAARACACVGECREAGCLVGLVGGRVEDWLVIEEVKQGERVEGSNPPRGAGNQCLQVAVGLIDRTNVQNFVLAGLWSGKVDLKMAWSNSRSVQVAGGLVQNRPTLDPEVGIGRILGVVGDQVYHTLDRKADWAWDEATDTAHGN